jgi:hypothetical protein
MASANMKRPAAKKASKLISKGISTGNLKALTKGAKKLSAIGGAKNEGLSSSNESKQTGKRMNQSLIARGERPINSSGFKESNNARRTFGKSIGKKTR